LADDKFLYLEEVEGKSALDWVKAQNQISLDHFSKNKSLADLQTKALELLNSKDRIPYGKFRGKYIYNFWQDQKNTRGIIRRTSAGNYLAKDTSWDTVLDVDQLAALEKENWVYKGLTCLEPAESLCLLQLSRGGKDASIYREYDLEKKSFVKDGFYLDEAKSDVGWVDKDTIIVGTDFGAGSLTDSGYPRIVKIWKRGIPLKDAKTLFEGDKSDVVAYAYRLRERAIPMLLVVKAETFYESEFFLKVADADVKKIPLPRDVEVNGALDGKLIVSLKSNWDKTKFLQGELVALNLSKLLAGDIDGEVIASPTKSMTLDETHVSENKVLVSVLENVQGKVFEFTPSKSGWKKKQVSVPEKGMARIVDVSLKGEALIEYENFTTPSSLYYFGIDRSLSVAKSLPSKFNGKDLVVAQNWVTSKDGTKVPYFVIHKKDLKYNGANPTLLYGYGGFEISMTPYYSSLMGNFWLEKGGVFVLSNIRGGGEFGPSWHKQALKLNRMRAYEDFFAIAEDLIERKITSPANLGAQGGSNGGLLMGVALTKRPDLFNAIVCQVPLLDMMRYHKLLAGASWVGEYGSPDIKVERDYLLTYSPYQNVKKDEKYPKALFMTSTKDDRVHPGHARKMAAKMKDMGHELYYYENTEGGHGGSANNKQRAYWYALMYTYLYETLGLK